LIVKEQQVAGGQELENANGGETGRNGVSNDWKHSLWEGKTKGSLKKTSESVAIRRKKKESKKEA